MAGGGWWRHLLLAGVIGDIVTYLAPGVTGESAPANQSPGSGMCWPIIGHLGVRGKGPAAVQWHARDESRDHLRRRDETSDTEVVIASLKDNIKGIWKSILNFRMSSTEYPQNVCYNDASFIHPCRVHLVCNYHQRQQTDGHWWVSGEGDLLWHKPLSSAGQMAEGQHLASVNTGYL